MTQYLLLNETELKQKNAYWTAREISQQPESWCNTAAIIETHRAEINAFLAPLLPLKELQIVLTGAGTSAYVGEVLAPHLTAKTDLNVRAVSTTDIVSNPHGFLQKGTPTLLISYARSGNSPESVAAVDIAEQVVEKCYHLVITCNESGELAKRAAIKSNSFSVLMPKETLDESFAMTSSFTSMLLSTLCIFTPDVNQLTQVTRQTEQLLETQLDEVRNFAQTDIERLVFLGAGSLIGYAKEAALKCLELTNGDLISYFETPLGFRHGPKTIINDKTAVLLMASSDFYSSLYDADLYNELLNDQQCSAVKKLALNSELVELDDVWQGLYYIVYCQIFAFYKSMSLGLTPDNPCPTGEVNRVVKGVTIYPLTSR
ncbi:MULTISPECIES: SIS domain-containing protein [unclassified Pseudoalteromonas]|uniref:SIS domain-containing protein n=1 Tax=Pseudoalteromonas TaxID=53246 RepID=UPI001432052A|nr:MULTISPECIES: SIS domain-containing protein [unclassified Pseudoalteromonas]MCG9708883.1 SIS domain-containing protein [Pseudoalteromonas sp. Isolate3]NIZ06613.1 SIS domain-containing protein [Pseudoalteromonas sp. HF66]QWV04205.1 SIS domain-containing protein [Pseudoalteromonas shioyasakiensis]